jgi:GntR family transcriptional regulator, transcriptional repressor for pyruvate dehydrogenase complex
VVYQTADDHHTLFSHHRAVFEAIRDREPERARDEMLAHLTFAEQRSSVYVKQGHP